MPPVYHGRPAIRAPTPGLKPAPTPASAPNNDLLQEFMQACIKKIRDQASVAPAALATEARDDTDRPFKTRNLDLYYGHSHIECYYFCQQYEDHFEVTGSLGHKRIPFAAGFLKDCILNRWQQHKTRMQCNRLVSMTWDKLKAFLRKSLGESNASVGHVWGKLRRDAQHQLEEVQDWAAHLEHFQSILFEFDANNVPQEGQLGRTFYDGLNPSIKLWIDDIGEDMPWDDLIRAANKAKARDKIQGSTHLDQRCPKGKRPLKMSLNSRDDQAEKPKATAPPAKADPPKSDQSKTLNKVRKDRNKKWQKEKREKKKASLEDNPQATRSNAVVSGKKKSGQNRG